MKPFSSCFFNAIQVTETEKPPPLDLVAADFYFVPNAAPRPAWAKHRMNIQWCSFIRANPPAQPTCFGCTAYMCGNIATGSMALFLISRESNAAWQALAPAPNLLASPSHQSRCHPRHLRRHLQDFVVGAFRVKSKRKQKHLSSFAAWPPFLFGLLQYPRSIEPLLILLTVQSCFWE